MFSNLIDASFFIRPMAIFESKETILIESDALYIIPSFFGDRKK